jgi:chromosome segregation ATPase
LRNEIEIIVGLRRDIGKIDTKSKGLKRQQRELDSRAKETRENLNAIKKDNAANSLRKRLSKRLNDFTEEADRIGRTIVTLQSQRLEKKIDLEDRLESLTFKAPNQP